MPSTGAETEPLTQAAANETQAAAQAAVTDAVSNPTDQTKTIAGTIQAAAMTTPGALTTTSVLTGGSAVLGNVADLPELMSVAWSTTWLYQAIKHHHLVDQDKHKVYWLLALSGLAAFAIVYFMSHGDIWLAAAHAFRTGPLGAYQASLNYHLAKPLGIFSSAADITADTTAEAAP